MKVIGITGAVGSGKSTIAKEVERRFHMRLIMADELGHQAYEKQSAVYPKLRELTGSFAMDASGNLDRRRIAEWAYREPENLKKLNELIHPYVKERIRQLICEAKAENRSVLIESAILIESGYEDICDEFWYVYVNEENRKKRLKESRGLSEAQIDRILANQKSDAFFREHCRCVIDNNASLQEALAGISDSMGNSIGDSL